MRSCVLAGAAIVFGGSVALTGMTPSASPATPAAVIDNTTSYHAADAISTKLVALIGIQLRAIYLSHNPSLADGLLAKDFERRYVLRSGLISQDRATFLSTLATLPPFQSVAYHIHDVWAYPKHHVGAAMVESVYSTKYFDMRYVEGLWFKNSGGRWRIERQAFAPVTDKKTEPSEVQIFLVERPGSAVAARLAAKDARGADAIIDDIVDGKDTDTISGDERLHTVLFVFREPPHVGAKITVEHQFSRPNLKLDPYVFSYEMASFTPHYVIANETHASYKCGQGSFCDGGTITYRISIDGSRVAEKTVKIER